MFEATGRVSFDAKTYKEAQQNYTKYERRLYMTLHKKMLIT